MVPGVALVPKVVERRQTVPWMPWAYHAIPWYIVIIQLSSYLLFRISLSYIIVMFEAISHILVPWSILAMVLAFLFHVLLDVTVTLGPNPVRSQKEPQADTYFVSLVSDG